MALHMYIARYTVNSDLGQLGPGQFGPTFSSALSGLYHHCTIRVLTADHFGHWPLGP